MIAIATDELGRGAWSAPVLAAETGADSAGRSPERTGSLRRIDQVLGELLAAYGLPAEANPAERQPLEAELAA